MKITKKQLVKIIKEEIARSALAEDANDDTFEMLDVIVDALGEKEALENVIKALERSKAHEVLQYIIQQWEIDWSPEEGYYEGIKK